VITAVILLGVMLSCPPLAVMAGEPPSSEPLLTRIILPPPRESAERHYLGLLFPNRSFRLTEVRAEIVIVQCFSLSCPLSQATAPEVNELYRLIAANDTIKERVKMVGLGMGDTDYEVATFKNLYRVPFPLFSDPDEYYATLLGPVYTPSFFVIRLRPHAPPQLILRHAGVIEDAEEFLPTLIAALGSN